MNEETVAQGNLGGQVVGESDKVGLGSLQQALHISEEPFLTRDKNEKYLFNGIL